MENENKNKTVQKTVKKNKSLRGKWGKVGAPPKPTKWPKGAFTHEQLFAMNKNQCHLSLRNKVQALLTLGSILALMPVKQPGGKVGRPKDRFVMKDNFKDGKMILKADAPAIEVVDETQPAEAPAPAEVPAAEVPAIIEATIVPIEAPAPVEAPAAEIPATTEPVTA